jgi:hypothetical protein
MNYGPWKALAAVTAVGAALAWRSPAPARVSEMPEERSVVAAEIPQDGKPVPSPPPAPIVALEGPLVVLTGNERGFIRPCGCSKPKLGGIDKRAHALTKFREKNPDLVAVSTGGLIVEGGRQQELKLDAFLTAMSAMSYDAWVPGPAIFGWAPARSSSGRACAPFRSPSPTRRWARRALRRS